MARQSVISRKKHGPPPTGKGVPILVRLQPPLLTDVDQWIAKQEIPFTRPEAIRRLIESALAAKSKRQSNRGES
jgi:metal-responsive CopG/Arc/MetJ family transcriptional regulator